MKIEIYTMENCVYCQESKKLLEENNYDYVEHMITEENSPSMIKFLQERLNIENIILPVFFIEDTFKYNIIGYFGIVDFIAKKNLFENGAGI
jgi:glutaredoxin